MIEIGETSRGYKIFREQTDPGGLAYWSDEISGGVMIFDATCLSIESIELALSDLKAIYRVTKQECTE